VHRAGGPDAAVVHPLRWDPATSDTRHAAVDSPEVMALLVGHGIVRSERALDALTVVERIRPHLIAAGVEMSDEQVSGDVAHVRFPGGCGAPDQGVKDEIMGVPRQSVPGLRDVVEVAREPAVAAFAPLASPRVGPP
jgi:hypothetical protein